MRDGARLLPGRPVLALDVRGRGEVELVRLDRPEADELVVGIVGFVAGQLGLVDPDPPEPVGRLPPEDGLGNLDPREAFDSIADGRDNFPGLRFPSGTFG